MYKRESPVAVSCVLSENLHYVGAGAAPAFSLRVGIGWEVFQIRHNLQLANKTTVAIEVNKQISNKHNTTHP